MTSLLHFGMKCRASAQASEEGSSTEFKFKNNNWTIDFRDGFWRYQGKLNKTNETCTQWLKFSSALWEAVYLLLFVSGALVYREEVAAEITQVESPLYPE